MIKKLFYFIDLHEIKFELHLNARHRTTGNQLYQIIYI